MCVHVWGEGGREGAGKRIESQADTGAFQQRVQAAGCSMSSLEHGSSRTVLLGARYLQSEYTGAGTGAGTGT